MVIKVDLKDRNGATLELGDMVELFDWSFYHRTEPVSLGIAELRSDKSEGRLSCNPTIVEDAYDFYTKALPICVKVNTTHQ